MNNTIVTGGTGFIGSRLILELLNYNISVTAIVRRKDKLLPEILNNPKCRVIEKNLQDITKEDFEQEVLYDTFYHIAWEGVGAENKNNLEIQLKNIEVSLNALEICKQLLCQKFIVSGTVAEYVFCKDVINTNEKQSPNDFYGAAKVATYYFLQVKAKELQQPFIWMILPSTFGEGRNDNNLITYTIKSLLKGDKPKYGKLTQKWDFLYITEVVKAIRLIGQSGKCGKIYGIGSGDYRELKEYIEIIRDIIDPSLKLGIGENLMMSEKTMSSCVNIDELVNDTGFQQEISFEEGIRKTIQYFKENIEYDK